MNRVVLLVASLALVSPALAQQPQQEEIPLRVTPAQADYLEKMLRVQKIEDAGLLYFSINNQIIQYRQNQQASQLNNFEKQVRDKIAADAAAAVEAKAKADGASEEKKQ